MLNDKDLKNVNARAGKFMKDFKQLLEKHKLHHLNLNLAFHSPGDEFEDCVKVLVTDGNGRICWKCPDDTSPCP